ncbi:SagB/ThcOx family dehydrogenase [Streptomyces alkaliterrae]|uniref:SagB/ThcOx family dehydrogenase n=1 Tax=Streptomyces alkaliterrae TaxID=2213162 RepID=A0A5P0YTQ6_9ACTN|nr:SagB/ThcOx family dehydrogenase [Streptomyces alkaliterrae]MBB1261630.1 SagB/ThcOx family dehydrogenase [Streptomyces alkaliterrae]MQS03696.1 SagB/ThcOx family dehydrogenase [Streptomyces alkaliterrae]
MRVRRREELVCRWRADGLEAGVPDRRQWIQLSPDLVKLLEQAGDGVELDELAAAFGAEHEPDVRKAVDALLDLGVLVRDDTQETPVRRPELWERWGAVAERFHTETRDADYLVDSPERADVAAEIVEEGGAPNVFKEYPDRPVVPLPRKLVPLSASVEETFAARRTHRAFTGQPVGLDAFSTLLFHTFAPHRFVHGGQFGTQQCRVSASAGGRHEVEAYVVVHDVVGVAPGLYHYAPSRHALELLDGAADRERVAALSYRQEPSYQGAFTVLTTAVANRLAWKYRHPRAYRLWMYDAGHYAQTFALAATALGLGPFQTVAFADSEVERFLGVDPAEEFAVYLLSAGVPDGAAGDPPLPSDFTFPPPTHLA